jgi:AcrR family transcriptional regulator
MFNTVVPTEKGELTRNAILESALQLFRDRGFQETTMRDVAARAGVALGAAYYYFPSKEAIIQAYYKVVQAEHNRRVNDAIANRTLNLRGRIQFVMHSKLDIVQNDRKLLGVIFRYSGEPHHPLSCLGPETAQTRHESIAVFHRAIGEERLPKDLQQLLPLAFWALHMGVLVLFIYDETPNQQRTRTLVDSSIDLATRLLSMAKNPFLKPIRSRLLKLLREADLLPELEPPLRPSLETPLEARAEVATHHGSPDKEGQDDE